MSDGSAMRCPGCGGEVPREERTQIGHSCPHCGAVIGVSRGYLLASYFLALASSLAISELLGLKAYSAPAWIPIFVLCFVAMAWITARLISPIKAYPEDARGGGVVSRNLGLFLGFWFACAFTVLSEGYVLGWFAWLVGSRQDMVESMDLWSIPLGLVNSAFTVRPEKSLAAVIGIVSANCYFWALGLTLVYKFVHSRIRKSRVTELGISGGQAQEEDDVF
jgi:uncharacterized protein (DUF983 family)